MPDSITPVGAEIQPPNPAGPMNTYSAMLGMQQQQLGIQQQRQALQGQAAEVAQAQQRNKEYQQVQAALIQGAKTGKYTDQNGNFDRMKAANDISQMGPYAMQSAGQLLSQANEVVQNQAAHQSLTLSRKKEIGDTFSSLAADPDLDNTKVIDAVEKLRQAHPGDQDFSRLLTSMSTHLPNTGDPGQLRNVMGAWAAAGTGETQAKPSTMDVGGQIQPGATNRFTGAFTPAGAGVQKTLAPTDQPAYKGQVAAATASAAGYSGGGASADIDRANEVGSMAQSASATVRLTKQIDHLADEINSGHLAAMLAKGSNYLGFSSVAEARTQLQKDLGQVRGAVAQRAGSDSRASEILEGYPTDTTPNNTIHAAMDYIRGTARQTIARNDLLAQYKKGDPSNLKGFQAADNDLVAHTDPLMHEFIALNPAERTGFYKRNFKNAQEAQEFKNSVAAMRPKNATAIGTPNASAGP